VKRETSSEPARLTVHVLGRFRVTSPRGTDVTPRGKKTRALLGYLALCPDHAADRRVAARVLWSDRGDDQAAGSLRQAIREIATSLGSDFLGSVESNRRQVALVPERWTVDLFDLAHSDPGFVGELLLDLEGCDPTFDQWLARERAARRDGILTALQDRSEWARRSGNADDAASWASAIARLSPTAPEAPLEHRVEVVSARATSIASVAPTVHVALARSAGELAPKAGEALVRGLTSSMARIRSLHLVPAVGEEDPRAAYTISLALDAEPDQARAWLELADSRSRRIVWTESFPSARLGDDALLELSAKLEWHIGLAERRRTDALAESSLGVDGLLHRALSHMQGMTQKGLEEGARLVARALDGDPRSGRAHAYFAFNQLQLCVKPSTTDMIGFRERAEYHARRATELAPDDAWTWAVRGHVASFLRRDMDAARPCLDRALGFDPSSGLVWAFSAACRSYVGDHDRALAEANRSARLTSEAESPFQSTIDQICANARAVAGDYGTAMCIAKQILATRPHQIGAYVPLLVGLGHEKRHAEAEQHAAGLREYLPEPSLDALAQRFPLVRANPDFARGLVRAGVAPN
jgi:tetratricopeptide (TPR) repeat protein